MSVITFQCYACNQVLQVGADNAGRKAKCSQCGTVLTIPALTADASASVEAVLPAALPAAAPPPASPPVSTPAQTSAPVAPKPPPVPQTFDEVAVIEEPPRRRRLQDDDEPPRRRRPDDRRDRQDDSWDDRDRYDVRKSGTATWDKVRVGLLLVFIALCVMAGASAFVLLGMLIGFASFMTWLIFARLGLTILLLATIPAIVGHVFWLFAPSNRRGSLGFAIAALSVAGVYLLFQLVGLIQVYGAFFGGAGVFGMLAHLLRAAHFMMIAFYVRSLAQIFEDNRLERGTMTAIILSSCLAGYDLLTGVVLLAMSSTFMGQGFAITNTILNILGAGLALAVYALVILLLRNARTLGGDANREPATPTT